MVLLKKILIIAVLIVFISCSEDSNNNLGPDDQKPVVLPKMNIVGYLPDYRIQTIPSTVAAKATELIYFSIEPKTNGELDLSRIDNQALNLLKKMKNDHGVRLILAVGGWDRSAGFAAMSTTPLYRNHFIDNLTNYCAQNGFDGIDYDWEFPANTTQRAGYDSLIVNTKKAIAQSGMTLSVALNPFQTLGTSSYQSLDYIHLMSYDHSGRHSTYEQAVKDVNALINRGIDKHKIRLGVPFYGRRIADFSQAITYQEIVSRYDPDPAVDEVDGYYFNGIETIKNKSRYALDQGLAGIMIWELGQDSHQKKSLLGAIYQTATEDSP